MSPNKTSENTAESITVLLPVSLPPILPGAAVSYVNGSWLIQALSVSMILVLGNCGHWWAEGLDTCSNCGHSQCPVSSHSFPGESHGAEQHTAPRCICSLVHGDLGTAPSCERGRRARCLQRSCACRMRSLQSWLAMCPVLLPVTFLLKLDP